MASVANSVYQFNHAYCSVFEWLSDTGYFLVVYKQPKIMHVLDLWLKNGVYTSDVIQPLIDFTAAPHSSELFHSGKFADYVLCFF